MKTKLSLAGLALTMLTALSIQAETMTWVGINGSGGSWSHRFNWIPAQVPGSNDTAILPLGVIVSVDVPTTVANVMMTSGTLDAFAGLTVNGTMSCRLATVQGKLTIATGAVLNFGGNPPDYHVMLACTLTNHGTVAWSAGVIQSGAGTVIHNFGLWDMQTNLVLSTFPSTIPAFGPTTFNNVGTFLKSGGAGTGGIGATFNHTGLLEVRTGILSFAAGGNFTGGTTTNAGGVIQLDQGAYTINGTITTTNVQLTSGTLNGVNVLRGEFTWVGSDGETLTGASVTLASNSVLHIATANNHLMTSSTLTNYGTVAWSGGLVQGRAGTVIHNFGLWDMQTNLVLSTAFGPTTFNNVGTFLKSSGAGTGGIGVSFSNTGTLEIFMGTLSLTDTYTLTGGTLKSRLNSLTDFGRLALGGSATLAGPLNVTLSGGFTPAAGNQFQLVSCSGLSGTFSPVNLTTGSFLTYSNNGVFLVWNVPAQILAPQLSGSDFTFSFATANGQGYTVERNDDLNTTNWVLHTNFIGNGLPAQIFAPVSGVPKRSFRVRSP